MYVQAESTSVTPLKGNICGGCPNPQLSVNIMQGKNCTDRLGQTFPITLSEKRGQTFYDTTYLLFIMWITESTPQFLEMC